MALDLKLKALNNLRGKADRFCRLIFRGKTFANVIGHICKPTVYAEDILAN